MFEEQTTANIILQTTVQSWQSIELTLGYLVAIPTTHSVYMVQHELKDKRCTLSVYCMYCTIDTVHKCEFRTTVGMFEISKYTIPFSTNQHKEKLLFFNIYRPVLFQKYLKASHETTDKSHSIVYI